MACQAMSGAWTTNDCAVAPPISSTGGRRRVSVLPKNLWMEKHMNAHEVSRVEPSPVFHGLTSKLKRLNELGQLDAALDILREMDQLGYVPSHSLYWSLLNSCKKKRALNYASQMHQLMRPLLVDPSNYFLAEYLISTLVDCGALDSALQVFHNLPLKTTYSWTALIHGHVESGDGPGALRLYRRMLQEGFRPDEFTCVSLIKACISTSNLEAGRAIHDYARENDYHHNGFLCSTLIKLYGKCDTIAAAEDIFATMPHHGVVVWTSLLAAYVEDGQGMRALQLYRQMREECLVADEQSFMAALQACCLIAEKDKSTVIVEGKSGKVMALEIGEALHADAKRKGLDSDLYIGNLLILMYGKCGNIRAAEHVFSGFTKKNVALWNAMLSAYTEQGHPDKALQLFICMHEEGQRPEERSFVTCLRACSLLAEQEGASIQGETMIKINALNIGKTLHMDANGKQYRLNLYVKCALLHMYGRCGDLRTVKRLFKSFHEHNLVSWNAMLSAHVEQGQGDKALKVYRQMQAEGLGDDDITLINLLKISGQTGSVDLCMQTYKDILLRGFDLGLLVMLNVLYAFGRCASMVNARAAFDLLSVSSLAPWNALISGYAQEGDGRACVYTYKKLLQVGLKPDAKTFLSLLKVCSCSGWVKLGASYFDSMVNEHGLQPRIEHYEQMVSLYGYAGHFDKVEDFLSSLPSLSDISIWLCLLRVCIKHGNVQLGKHAFDCAVRLQPKEAASYLLLFTVYVKAGLQNLADLLEVARQKKGALKREEVSWCEHEQQLRSFSICEQQKLHHHHMYRYLLDVLRQLEEESEFTSPSFLGTIAANADLQPSLCSHSQLLGLAFTLLKPPFEKPIRLKKDAYMCQDCHELIKVISHLKKLCILVIDDNRAHLFQRGQCSCRDYFYTHT